MAKAVSQGLAERWQAVFENVPDIITELDRDGHVKITNSFPGLDLADVIGKNIFDIIPARLHAGLRSHMATVFDTGEATAVETHFSGPDRESWWITRYVPVRTGDSVSSVILIGTEFTKRKLAEQAQSRLIQELQEAIQKVRTLSGLLPICASCKNIRDDKGYWRRIEGYISEHSDAEFSHGLCPPCATDLHAKLDDLGKPAKPIA